MPALVNYRGDDDYHTGGSLCSKDSTRLLSFYGSPCKRQRISDSYFHFLEEEKKPSIEVLPDEILYEIFRRLSGGQARSAAACVSSRWLTVLSNVRTSEMVHDVHEPSDDVEMVQENDGFLTRCLEGKKATDRRLQSVAVGTSARGGLGKLSVRGSNKVTKIGLTAIAHGCPSLKVLSLWNVPSIGDESLIEISKECRLLEKLDLSHCNSISNKGISAIAQNCPNLSSLTIESCINVGNESLQAVARCCPNLQSITIKDCPNVGDQGVATLLSSLSSVLKKVKLQSLNITDFSLAVIGHYGKSITNLALIGLQTASQKGFWAMGSAKGLQSLTSLTVVSCYGITDLSLEAIAKGCGLLKQMLIKKCCFVSDKGLVSFTEAAESLECLQLEECNRISQHGILKTLKSKLKSLTIVKCMGIKDIALKTSDLTRCESLRSLTIRDCIGFGNTTLAVFGTFCPQLQNLELSGLCGITDSGLYPILENCQAGLVKVNLSNCLNLTDKVVVDLAKIHGETLKVLNLEGCRRITDESLASISDYCFLLSDLDVSKCCVTDNGLRCLSEGVLIGLQILSVSCCSKVSNKSVPFLKKLGQTLVGLNIQQCNLISSSLVDSLVENLWRCDILY
ncbi:putative leucine-rich repeat domain superfamily, F-box-like domain superfamily [Helianthus annuus]|nr:putative leucine-rich repeat domain superfamily, F-box-like domain superfamily [Helianthus annuus]